MRLAYILTSIIFLSWATLPFSPALALGSKETTVANTGNYIKGLLSDPGILKVREMLGINQPQQRGGLLSAMAGMPKPNPIKEYFDKYVGPEELGSSDMKKYYNKDRETYKVYQLPGESRPTVGKGVFLDDLALEQLGLAEIPKEGAEIPAKLVDNISYNRWGDAVRRATKELGGTKGSAATNALAEMIYQIGAGVVVPGSEKHFEKTLRLLKEGKIKEAQKEAKDSSWYRQTKNRANKVISRFEGTQ